MTVAELIDALPGLALDECRERLMREHAGAARKGAISALEERIEELVAEDEGRRALDEDEDAREALEEVAGASSPTPPACEAHAGLESDEEGHRFCPDCLAPYDESDPAWVLLADREARAAAKALADEAKRDRRPRPIVRMKQEARVRIEGRLVWCASNDEIAGHTAAHLLEHHPHLVTLIAGI